MLVNRQPGLVESKLTDFANPGQCMGHIKSVSVAGQSAYDERINIRSSGIWSVFARLLLVKLPNKISPYQLYYFLTVFYRPSQLERIRGGGLK